MTITVRIQQTDFDIGAELAQLRAGQSQVGALVSFVGTVRASNDGAEVRQMELEHYPGMTEQAIAAIIAQAQARWPILAALVIHRVGVLQPTEQIVLVAVSAGHRGVAFAACEFILDYLKTEAPFWKKEWTQNGARWVDARVTDSTALDKWRQAP